MKGPYRFACVYARQVEVVSSSGLGTDLPSSSAENVESDGNFGGIVLEIEDEMIADLRAQPKLMGV